MQSILKAVTTDLPRSQRHRSTRKSRSTTPSLTVDNQSGLRWLDGNRAQSDGGGSCNPSM
jgi:hypothetical protein